MGSHGAASIFSAIESLGGDTIRQRSKGLEDLRRYFGRGVNQLDGIENEELHAILERIFKIVCVEKQSYLRANKSTALHNPTSRLSSAASALRAVVEAANFRFDEDTVSALLDHIVDILSATDAIFFEPVDTDYLRCFCTILQHQSHAEHLRSKQWLVYVDFILDAINRSLNEDSDDAESTPSRHVRGSSRVGQSMAIRGSQVSVIVNHRPSSTKMEDAMLVLSLLTSSTNAPLSARTSQISEALTAWISSMSRALVPAFESLNHLLPVALTEDIMLAVRIFKDICAPIQRLWNDRSTALRDQLVVSLYHLRHIYLHPSTTDDAIDASLLDLLIGVIWSENEKRLDKDLLQLDALSFMAYSNPPPLSICDISPSSNDERVETPWSVLYVVSLLLAGLNNARRSQAQREASDKVNKRRRLEHSYADIFWRIHNTAATTRIVALQVAVFTTEYLDGSTLSLTDEITNLEMLVTEDDPLVSSWTMVLLARLSLINHFTSPAFHDFWRRIWTAAARVITNSLCSRYGCYLMQTMVRSGLARTCVTPQAISDSIFTDGNSGPAILTDTAIILLTATLENGLFDNETIHKHFAGRSLNWLEARWTIPTVPDLMRNFQTASYGQPFLLAGLLQAITGKHMPLRKPDAPIFAGPTYRAAYLDDRDLSFTRFIAAEDCGTDAMLDGVSLTPKMHHSLPPSAYLTTDAVSEFLALRLRSFRLAWSSLTSERIANVNTDIASIAATACALSAIVSSWNKLPTHGLQLATMDLMHTVCESSARRSAEIFQEFMVRISSRLLQIQSDDKEARRHIAAAREQLVMLTIERMKQGPESQNIAMLDYEFMDSFDGKSSQSTHMRTKKLLATSNRADIPQALDLHSQFLVNVLYMKLDSLFVNGSGTLDAVTMARFWKELLSLDDDSLFTARVVIQDLLCEDIAVRRIDVARLVSKIGQICLEKNELERSEAALCLCLRVVTKFAELWAGTERDELADSAFEIYEWYIKIGVGKSIASKQVLQCMSLLLEKLLKLNPSYAHGDLASPRTTLLQIVKKGSAGLKFQLASQLSRLFEGYILSEHTAIFDDIVENLPTDPDDREGIKARLYILAYLGARWHTVLRDAVYRIFETAANVPQVSTFARKCIRMVCHHLKIDNVKSLFQLFSSQIFYTWLEKNETVSMMPAGTFGYDNVKALLHNNQDEIAAHLVMRASPMPVKEVMQYMSCSWEEVLEVSFARAFSYAIIADVSQHRASGSVGPSEKFLLSTLGEDRYGRLLTQHFAEALSIILLRMIDDRGFEKSLESRNDQGSLATSYKEMCNYSSSRIQLPPGQQPSFRAKYLLPILKRLSSRVGLELEHLWSPPLLVYALRSLLDDTNPALGPLHACAIMRKIRVVLSMSSAIAVNEYPLEMVLHGVRPYVTNFHCSADVLGIVWFMLERGRTYLEARLEFVTGLGVTMFASLSQFVTSSQDSTTQESHFQTTISHANDFRKWLSTYLNGFKPEHRTSHASINFQNILDAAKDLTLSGSNSHATSEGTLLYHLLMDQASTKPLLSRVFFHHTIQVLCKDFNIVADPIDDILAVEDDLIKATPILWKILHESKPATNFELWIGQSLGRASLFVGPEAVGSHARQSERNDSEDSLNLTAINSYSQIISVLIDHLWDGSRAHASAAEHSLRLMFSTITMEQKNLYLDSTESEHLYHQLRFADLPCPPATGHGRDKSVESTQQGMETNTWAASVAQYICQQYPSDPILTHLENVISVIHSLSSSILPAIIHLALLASTADQSNVRDYIASAVLEAMNTTEDFSKQRATLALQILVYLRRCSMSSEVTMGQRNSWLPIDYKTAARAAFSCGRYNDSLLMLEIHASQHALAVGRTSKRASTGESVVPRNLIADIYCNLDDPDFFYGTTQDANFQSIVDKLCHERDGNKALSFQSALYDASLRNTGPGEVSRATSAATVSALNMANFHALAGIVQRSSDLAMTRPDNSSHSPLNLQQWNIGNDLIATDNATTTSSVFHTLSSAAHLEPMLAATNEEICALTGRLRLQHHRSAVTAEVCTSLAVLAEVHQALSTQDHEAMPASLTHRLRGRSWVEREQFGNIEPLLLARESFALALKKNASLQAQLKITPQLALLLEVEILRSSLSIGRAHDMSQFSLNRAACMSDLIESTNNIGLKVDVAILYDTANTFWSRNETTASIKILQSLHSRKDLKGQAILISKSEILTDLGQKLTQARLDRADEITSQYLRPAIEALDKHVEGAQSGRVYHNFAVFCDQQLRDPENLDEYHRMERLRNRKKQEVIELEKLKKEKEGKERDQLRGHLLKAQTWFKLDDLEWRRLKKHREGLISDCLENYLRSLSACNNFPNDVLRFLALWLEQSQNSDANSTVDKYVRLVETYKFAPLMNQLTSRILDGEDTFQKILFELMFRICNDHPYHSLYQVFATSKSKGQKNDTVANSRHKAATRLSETVMRKGAARSTWVSVHNTCIAYVRVAQEKASDREVKSGSKVQLQKSQVGGKLEQAVLDTHQKIPPPTMKIALRPDGDYSSIPKLVSLDPYVTIAGGVSAPKIVTALATDGSLHKMLLKGGNDDLRQDSIMEQVFEQVSNLLQDHRTTRQRNLSIRTYKVIPLMHNAGIIEFVKNTTPLHDFVLPAHSRYYPKDYKANRCRREIADAQTKPLAQRLQAYSNVTSNFHPVMRFFFMEHFLDPDDWFQKRLNYSRSTAAISMLGHVLGLGDRHGHNILLDTKTGEAVHIDLGVAFEAGRVLPVPEVVPFRLTRDIVDGMGISGVEGVFRRCCIFTLEALRQDQEAIMTILDVLRYDPLYSWSISPIRLQRMQENQEQTANAAAGAGASMLISPVTPSGTFTGTSNTEHQAAEPVLPKHGDANELGEADRALAVVARKLGKGLSVEATVNDLIRQAMDERNLAVLYCGWAAYA